MYKKISLIFFTLLILNTSFAQQEQSTNNYENATDILLNSNSKLSIGGYGEVHYNQPLSDQTRENGALDVHRMVLLFGYQFSPKVQFVTELEFEHVSEVYVEQAFLQYKLSPLIQFRAGLLLIPMGIINEFHEPTTFNGVERPLIDGKIAPTTWREIGFGATGTYLPASLKYQLYVVNGFSGYDGGAKFNGKNGLRSGRQKGAESYISAPNFSGKLEYFGLRGLNIGLSAYVGKSQSSLYDGLDKDDAPALAKADSSVVGISILGLDARYTYRALQLRGQLYYMQISNSAAYNAFTASNGITNDLGSAMQGFYLEAAYDVLKNAGNSSGSLFPFVRYEAYNTQLEMASGLSASQANEVQAITAGLSWHLARGAVVKSDLQFTKTAAQSDYQKTLNIGFGIFF